jgi:hypothetical protein
MGKPCHMYRRVGRRAGDITGDLRSSSGNDGVFSSPQLSCWLWSYVIPSNRHREFYTLGLRSQSVRVTTPFWLESRLTMREAVSPLPCAYQSTALNREKGLRFLVYVGKLVWSENPKAIDNFEDLGLDKIYMLIYWTKYTGLGSYPPGYFEYNNIRVL